MTPGLLLNDARMTTDALRIRQNEHEALLNGEVLSLTRSEFRVLALLADSAGNALTRRQIIELLYGTPYASTERAVDVVVWGLRKKLGPIANRLETVRGVGYRFVGPLLPI